LLKHREIRLSVRDRLSDMFIAPDANTNLSAFNVYTEAQFRAVQLGTFTPTFPYIYLLDSFIPPVAQRVDQQQPHIVIEVSRYEVGPYQMGDRMGRNVDLMINVFGRSRGERDDIGAFIADYFGSGLSIKIYSSANTPGTEIEVATVQVPIVVQDIFTDRLSLERIGSDTELLERIESSRALYGATCIYITLLCKT